MNTSKEFVSRLLKYKNVLTKLKKLGLIKVFSDNLGDASGLTSSQVRKDFAQLEISGNKKGGYLINDLLDRLDIILGKGQPQKVVVVGCGNIGKAMIAFGGFHGKGVDIVAGFDSDKTKINEEAPIPIYAIEKLQQYLKDNKIKVGIIAVPESAAPEVYETMVSAGVKGFLNFARVYIREAEGTVVNTINIELKIENLFYFVNLLEKNQRKK